MSRVEKTVDKLEGTETVMVNLLTGSMQVTFDEKKINAEEIINQQLNEIIIRKMQAQAAAEAAAAQGGE